MSNIRFIMEAIYLCNNKTNLDYVYSKEIKKEIESIVKIDTEYYDLEEIKENEGKFDDVKFIFSTWGMPKMEKEDIKKYFKNLEVVFYGAGSVQGFAKEFLECGVKVSSSWAANGIPVAEYTTAQIILANKGYFQMQKVYKNGDHKKAREMKACYLGNYGNNVGLIGAGMIGRLVINYLKAYNLNIKVFDPFLSDERAKKLGVEKVDLKTLFSTCETISNHLANNEQTKNMLNKDLFKLMGKYATFINTGRGAQVVEDDLVWALKEEPTRTAILDVTFPEPVIEGHPFYSLENVYLTPHIAGSFSDETHRMAEYQKDECKRYLNGDLLKYEVNLEMLKTMA